MILATALLVVVWFTIGGYRDIRYLFRRLRTQPGSLEEDGRVEDRHNVGEKGIAPVTGHEASDADAERRIR